MRERYWGATLMVAMLCSACTHQVQTSRAAPATAVGAAMTRQVENAVNAGDGDLEAHRLRQRLAANENDLDARLALARLYAKRGLPDLAIEHYRMAAARKPDSASVTLLLAKSLREMNEPGEALKTIAVFLNGHPNTSWELLSLRGIIEDEHGRFARGEASHRSALALAPDRSSLHNNLGYNLLLQEKSDKAAAEFRRALELNPHSAIAHNNLGAAIISGKAMRHPQQAVAEMQRSSDPAVAHNNLAAVLIEQGRYSEAREELETALTFRRDLPAVLANLKLVADKDGRPVIVPPGNRQADQPVHLWHRVASTLSRAIMGTVLPESSGSGSQGTEPVASSGGAIPEPNTVAKQ